MTSRSFPSIGWLAARIQKGQITATSLVERCLETIASRDHELNAFITILADTAREQAREADAEIAAGHHRGPLHGIPVSVKDLIDLKTFPTTAASRVRAGHRATTDAPVLARLREAGVIFIGKCNLHEFAFGTTGEESAYGPTRNPHGTDHSPGGSSSGSAVSVATGMAVGSIGTDTGGSIRIPAAACGVVGLKPTFGELTCDGVVPLAHTLDHVGPITRTVADAELLYRAMVGSPRPPALRRSAAVRDTVRLGIPRRYFLELLDPRVRLVFEQAVDRLRSAGCLIDDVEIPHAEDIAPVYLNTVLAEAAAIHARTLKERPGDYSQGVRLRLEMGQDVLAEDYARAQKEREVLRREVDAALDGRQALLLPTLPIPAPLLGARTILVDDVTEEVRALMLRLTQLFDLTGHPAVTIPCGSVGNGLPCGAQLVGELGRTLDVLDLAVIYEPTLRFKFS